MGAAGNPSLLGLLGLLDPLELLESCNGGKIFRELADSPDSKFSKSYGFSDSGRRGGEDFDKFRQSRGGG